MILMLQQCICIKFTIVTRNEHLNTEIYKNIIFFYISEIRHIHVYYAVHLQYASTQFGYSGEDSA